MTIHETIREIGKEFEEKYGDKEGCQANNPNCGEKLPVSGNFECSTCEKWGGKEGVVKDFKRPLATTKQVTSFLSHALLKVIEETVDEIKAKLPKVITPTIEPSPNKLSQNQIFAGGQVNMAMRTTEMLDSLITSSKEELGESVKK